MTIDVRPQELPAFGSVAGDALDIADLVEEGVIAFGLDMIVTAWNSEAERIYGWAREEVIGRVIQSAVQCSPSEPLKVILEKVRQGNTWRGEFARTSKSGETVMVRAKWVLRRDAKGAPSGIVETSTDITTLRKTEEALQRIQFQYQNLFQASVASFWELEFAAVGTIVRDLIRAGVSDLRGYFRAQPESVRAMIRATRIVDFNEQSFAMFGRGDRDELKASLDPLWPDESLPVFAESVALAFEKKPHFSAETVFVALDGRRYDTIFNVSYPPVLQPSSRLLIGIVDVTQAKAARTAQEKSERRYRDLFHMLPVPLMQVNSRGVAEILERARSEGVTDFAAYMVAHPELTDSLLNGVKVIEVNRRMVGMLRAQSADEFETNVARYWTESPEIFREVMAARYAGKSGYEALIKMPAHDGTVLDVLFFQTFASITGEPHDSVVQLIDVSDRVKAQEKLARIQAEIAHAARVSVLGELTASIAHEVSQPLTAIESNSEAGLLWLARSPPDLNEVKRLSERTVAEAQRAAGIIERIRSMALRSATEKANIDPNAVASEALMFLSHELQRHNVRVTLDLDPAAPSITGDRVQLQQVVVNLTVNAVQAIAAVNGSARQIFVRTRAPGDGTVRIAIEDTGPGIPEDKRGRVFDSFFTTKAMGMGMGLAICRSIIEAHGGVIAIGDRQGGGASFEISLPADPNENMAPALPAGP
jgi:PAS domain S-box-containing protein